MARSSLWPPALCAQTKVTLWSGGGSLRCFQLVDDAAHDTVEERLLRLLVEPQRLAGPQAPHDLRPGELEHVLAATIAEEVARLFRADEHELGGALFLAAVDFGRELYQIGRAHV